MEGDIWPNCLGVVRKAGIRCPPLAGSGGGGGICDEGAAAGGAGGVLSTFYVLMHLKCSKTLC